MPSAPSSAVSSTSPSSWIVSTTLSVNRLGLAWHDQVVFVCVSRERKFLGFLIHVSNAFCCRPADPKGRKRRIKCCVQKIKLQSLQSGFVVFFQPTLKGSKSFELFLIAITLININLTTWWWMRNVLVDLVMVHTVQARFFQITNLDLQMQIDSKFPLQPRHKYYITQYEELELSLLTQMKDDYTTNSHWSHLYTGEGTFELGNERVKPVGKSPISAVWQMKVPSSFVDKLAWKTQHQICTNTDSVRVCLDHK